MADVENKVVSNNSNQDIFAQPMDNPFPEDGKDQIASIPAKEEVFIGIEDSVSVEDSASSKVDLSHLTANVAFGYAGLFMDHFDDDTPNNFGANLSLAWLPELVRSKYALGPVVSGRIAGDDYSMFGVGAGLRFQAKPSSGRGLGLSLEGGYEYLLVKRDITRTAGGYQEYSEECEPGYTCTDIAYGGYIETEKVTEEVKDGAHGVVGRLALSYWFSEAAAISAFGGAGKYFGEYSALDGANVIEAGMAMTLDIAELID
jgi:hypothetical protein